MLLACDMTAGGTYNKENKTIIMVAKDEDVLEISKRLLAQNKEAYEVLAK